MQNKLQELTDKLYNEGLSKGKQEGEAILADAKLKAEQIIADARKEAEAIIAGAGKEAEELKTRIAGDIRLAATQSITVTRQEIEALIVSRIADKEISSALTSADFVKDIIGTVARTFNPAADEPSDLEAVLPESMKKELEPFIKKELSSIMKGNIDITFSKKLSGGFTIGPKDGGYFVSFTDTTFRELITAYLRPATRKFLFGEE